MRNYTYRCDECGREENVRATPDTMPKLSCHNRAMRVVIVPPLMIKLDWKPSHRQMALTRPNRER